LRWREKLKRGGGLIFPDEPENRENVLPEREDCSLRGKDPRGKMRNLFPIFGRGKEKRVSQLRRKKGGTTVLRMSKGKRRGKCLTDKKGSSQSYKRECSEGVGKSTLRVRKRKKLTRKSFSSRRSGEKKKMGSRKMV